MVPGELVGLYSRLEAAVVVVAFEARIVGGAARTTPEALEVRAFAPIAIPWGEIAFKTSFYAIRDWVRLRAPGRRRARRLPREPGPGLQPRSTNTFLTLGVASSASRPRSLPIPDCL